MIFINVYTSLSHLTFATLSAYIVANFATNLRKNCRISKFARQIPRNSCIWPFNFVSLHSASVFSLLNRAGFQIVFLVSFAARQMVVCRLANYRSTGGKRLFDGRKIPDAHSYKSRKNWLQVPNEPCQCPDSLGLLHDFTR